MLTSIRSGPQGLLNETQEVVSSLGACLHSNSRVEILRTFYDVEVLQYMLLLLPYLGHLIFVLMCSIRPPFWFLYFLTT